MSPRRLYPPIETLHNRETGVLDIPFEMSVALEVPSARPCILFLFPLNGAGGFGRDIVDDPVDALDAVDNPV